MRQIPVVLKVFFFFNYYVSWLEDAQENPGNQREVKLSSVPLKGTHFGERACQESRAGLANCRTGTLR